VLSVGGMLFICLLRGLTSYKKKTSSARRRTEQQQHGKHHMLIRSVLKNNKIINVFRCGLISLYLVLVMFCVVGRWYVHLFVGLTSCRESCREFSN